MTAYLPITVSRAAGADMATGLVPPGGLGTDTFPPGADIFLRVKTTGTATTVTVINTGANAGPRGTFLAPQVMAPAPGATGDRLYGPFPADAYADPADSQVHVTYSATTGVTAGVYRLSS